MNIDWDGKGLPPVGTVCLIADDKCHDAYYAHHAGRQARIILHDVNSSGNRCAVYWVLDDLGFKEYHALTGDRGNFKAIRSAEQIAADKRLHEIRNACTAINSKVADYNVNLDCSAAMRATIEAMIDAGYRKFEIVEDDV